MKRTEFNDSIGLLKQVYGDHKYPPTRTEILWDRFKYLNSGVFRQAVESLIASEPYAPLLAKFQDILQEELAESRKQETQNIIKNSQDCTRCKNLGVVSFFKKDEPRYYGPYSFQCKCPKGPVLAKGLPKQYSGMEDNFELHWAHRVGLVNLNSERPIKRPQTTEEFKTPGQKFGEMEMF